MFGTRTGQDRTGQGEAAGRVGRTSTGAGGKTPPSSLKKPPRQAGPLFFAAAESLGSKVRQLASDLTSLSLVSSSVKWG